MKKKWILVMDSGVGGIWTLNKIKEILPKENYIYFMDRLNAPYGNKSTVKLKKLAYKHIAKLRKIFDIKVVVLACNTLSSVCYNFLKQKFFDIPIIKIEPFFNPYEFQNKNTLVLATTNTIRHNKNLNIYKDYSNIFLKGYGSLAKKIDAANGDYDQLLLYLTRTLSQYKDKNIQNIVLGCTHFNYIKKQLTKIFGEVDFFENSPVVANRVESVLLKLGKKNKKNKQPQVLFVYKI